VLHPIAVWCVLVWGRWRRTTVARIPATVGGAVVAAAPAVVLVAVQVAAVAEEDEEARRGDCSTMLAVAVLEQVQ